MSDENAMNVDGDGFISQNDRDVDDIEMESNVIHSSWVSEAGVNEAGWFVAAPTTSIPINDLVREPTAYGVLLEDSTSTSAALGPALVIQQADDPITTSIPINESVRPGSLLGDSASESTSAVPLESVPLRSGLVIQQANDPTTNATRLPRTTRFTEMLSTSDDQVLHVLKGTLEEQLERVTRDAKLNIIDDNATSQARLGTSNHGSSSIHPKTSLVVDNQILLSENQSGSSGHISTTMAVDFSAGPAPHEEHKEASDVNVTYSDFQKFIRSFEKLSANVQVLIDQGGSSNPGGPGPGPGPAKRPTHQAYMSGRMLFQGDDEREEASARIYKKRPIKENTLHKILRDLLVEFGLRISKRQKSFVLKDSVPKAVADAYLVGRGDGPTLDNLRLDWSEPMATPWNSTAIFILTSHVLERLRNNYYTELKYEDWMTAERIFSELKDKLTESKEEYDNAIDLNAPDSDITAAENRARYASRKLQKKIRNRRNVRRRTLYNCRLKIINENLGTHPAWENALQLMYVLGDTAMSDDETDVERSTRRKKVVRRVETPWACVQLKNMINTIDLYYSRFFWDGFQKPGPGPRDRLTTIVSESPRPTPRSLPGNCYSNMYINSLTPYQRSLLRCKRNMEIPALPLPPA